MLKRIFVTSADKEWLDHIFLTPGILLNSAKGRPTPWRARAGRRRNIGVVYQGWECPSVKSPPLKTPRISGPPAGSPRFERSSRRRRCSKMTSEEKSKATNVVDWTEKFRQMASTRSARSAVDLLDFSDRRSLPDPRHVRPPQDGVALGGVHQIAASSSPGQSAYQRPPRFGNLSELFRVGFRTFARSGLYTVAEVKVAANMEGFLMQTSLLASTDDKAIRDPWIIWATTIIAMVVFFTMSILFAPGSTGSPEDPTISPIVGVP